MVHKAKIVSVPKKVKVPGASHEAEEAISIEAQPRNAKLYFCLLAILLANAWLTCFYYCIISIIDGQGSLRLIEQQYIPSGLEHGTWYTFMSLILRRQNVNEWQRSGAGSEARNRNRPCSQLRCSCNNEGSF